MARFCFNCGGDADQPDHEARCDGQQGRHEAAAAVADWVAGDPGRSSTVTITTPRATTVQAFYTAIEAGVIETRRAQVYVGLRDLGIATSGEVFEHLREVLHFGLRYDSNTCARFTELRDLGLIREVGERKCRITKMLCITWEVVPADEYAGEAIVHRCKECGQIVSREVPRL